MDMMRMIMDMIDDDKIPAYCGVIVTFKNSFSIVHTSISSILRSHVHRSVCIYIGIYVYIM
jgi:hypothetical protein